MLEAPKRAVKFAANDFWGNTYQSALGTDTMTQGLSVLTGCSAGATESVVVVPFELVKIRLQDKNSLYKGPMDVLSQIVKKEGLLGLYAGLEPTFWRYVSFPHASLDSCLSRAKLTFSSSLLRLLRLPAGRIRFTNQTEHGTADILLDM
jgi:hypothetical protein